jgi:hypothetical protein
MTKQAKCDCDTGVGNASGCRHATIEMMPSARRPDGGPVVILTDCKCDCHSIQKMLVQAFKTESGR